jgi:hypothetical protein
LSKEEPVNIEEFEVGLPLVKKGIKSLTGIDIESKELTAEDKQKILDSQIEIMKIDFEKLKLEYDNTNSARDMQKVSLQQDDIFSKRYVYYLATFWSFVAVVYIFLITFISIPEANVRFADTTLGFLLGTIVATIINYFFGSSKSSSDKNQLLKESK